MSSRSRQRRMQLLREVEGCLELLAACGQFWQAEPDSRRRLAERALSLLDRVPAEGGHTAEVFVLRGQALRAMDRWREAIGPLQEASRLDPENLSVWLALGWCYKRVGRLDLAIEALEDAFVVDDTAGIVHYNLACYWSLAGNAKLAIEYLSSAMELEPRYRDLAPHEADFDPIRQHPAFKMITSVIV